jgi:glycosyltransferase XagB
MYHSTVGVALFARGADWDWIAATYGSAAETATPVTIDQLPLLSQAGLVASLKALTPKELAELLRDRVLVLDEAEGVTTCAVCGHRGFEIAAAAGWKIAARIPAAEFHFFIRRIKGHELRHAAAFRLARQRPAFSARRRLTTAQVVFTLLLVSILVSASLIFASHVVALVLSLMSVVFFLSILAVKLLALLPQRPVPPVPIMSERALPVYSVLVPLFKETAVLPQLIEALAAIRYPRDRLDVKIVVEECDAGMRDALRAMKHPRWIEVIVVPDGLPRTKPKALNYALNFAWGELVTIYDAEDIPQPDQLRDCAAAFAAGNPDLACLQAELRIFNARENWLTHQFAVEYAALFSRILPALAEARLPLPLGGTSNHFRMHLLRRIGGWDAHNVTEDADLGLRLARCGYKVGIVRSHTSEEGCVRFANWQRQRARWLKGFLHTWLVHMRHPVKTFRQLGPGGFWILQTCTLGTFLSALVHPFLTVAALHDFLFADLPAPGFAAIDALLRGLYLAVLCLGYGMGIALSAVAMRDRGLRAAWFVLLTMPFYWFLMSISAMQALWQFATDPHGWNKTVHGQSRVLASVARRRCGGALLHGRQQ